MRTGPTSLQTRKLVEALRKLSRKSKASIWNRVADDLVKPTRQRREVNLSAINKFAKKGEIVIVPGKVLGEGIIDHDVTVAAFKFSESAREKIGKVGKAVTISQLIEKSPSGKGVRIIG